MDIKEILKKLKLIPSQENQNKWTNDKLDYAEISDKNLILKANGREKFNLPIPAPDVIDNLDSTSATEGLSANQGKLLNDRLKLVETNNHNHSNKDELDKIVSGKVDSWDSKAEGTHTHNATDIIEDASRKFITDEEREKWNNASTEIEKGNPYRRISISEWETDSELNLYKKIINHNLGITDVFVEVYSTDRNMNQIVSYRIIDENNIEIYSEINSNIDVLVLGGNVKKIEPSIGAEINDESTDTISTWSSQKISQELAKATPSDYEQVKQNVEQNKTDIQSIKTEVGTSKANLVNNINSIIDIL